VCTWLNISLQQYHNDTSAENLCKFSFEHVFMGNQEAVEKATVKLSLPSTNKKSVV
jgi:hypothetical protein